MAGSRGGSRYPIALEELELYFCAAASMLGERAAPFEGGGGHVWDPPREARAHWQMVRGAWTGQIARVRDIARRVSTFQDAWPGDWYVAMAVLTPRRWPDMLAAEMSRGPMGGNLCGLLLTSERLRHAYLMDALGSLPEWHVDVAPADLLRFADRKASSSNTEASHKARFFDPLRSEGEARFDAALESYEKLRRTMGRQRAENDLTDCRRALG